MHIHRDIRFSFDKSPYKLNVGIQFRHESGKDVHVALDECFIGAGSWMPDRNALLAYRRVISERPGEWFAVKRLVESADWSIDGHYDALKRPPHGSPATSDDRRHQA